MDFFSKDTLFNDLPQNIKQRIINIRNVSLQHRGLPGGSRAAGSPTELTLFDHISVPSSASLCETFLRMAQAIEKIENVDATENLKKEARSFSEFVGFYRLETNNTDFIGELEKTIGMMENKFERLMN